VEKPFLNTFLKFPSFRQTKFWQKSQHTHFLQMGVKVATLLLIEKNQTYVDLKNTVSWLFREIALGSLK